MRDAGFDTEFDKELIEMWQEQSYPMAGESTPLARQLAGWVQKFDRRIFWRNFIEYTAAVVVLIRSGFEIVAGDRYLIAPLTSIAVVVFVVTHIWWKHRHMQQPDPSAAASTYRAMLLARIDRQIRLTERVRYWYVLPAWIFFLTVFVSGTIKHLVEPPERISTTTAVLGLAGDFLAVTGLCVFVIWLNERLWLRKLQEKRNRVYAIDIESTQGGPAL